MTGFLRSVLRRSYMTRWVVFVIGLAIAVSSSAVLAQSSSPNVSGIVSSPADKLRGETEKLKVEVELQKLAAVRTQFYFDWGYKVALGVAALLLLRWAVPQFSEISVPFGGGMFTAKRAPKQPNPAAPQDGPMPFADVAAALKR